MTHQEQTEYLDPYDPEFEALECLELIPVPEDTPLNSNEWISVNNNSKLKLKEILHRAARCFTKKFNYGPAYEYSYRNSEEYSAALFIDGSNIIGGCAIHYNYKNVPDLHGLQWVWLHPDYRRSGVFKRFWNDYVKELDSIAIESPISVDMIAFIENFIIENDQWTYLNETVDPELCIILEQKNR